MNNRKAITLLRNLEDSLDSYCGLNEEGKTAFRMAIEALSCSEISNNWIPCSERLPEINKEVLVTNGESCWVCSLFDSPDIEDGLYQWEDNYGHWHEFETWVAWMPLPEPYRKE